MDLSKIKPTSRTIEIRHPATGKNIGLRWQLVSLDDERLAKLRRTITDKRLHLEARGKSFKAEDIEANRMSILTTASIGWEWYNPTGKKGDAGFDPEAQAVFNGEIPEFNLRNVKDVLTELTWIGDQINESLGETESFFGS